VIGVLNVYLSLSDLEVDCQEKPLLLDECITQINQARQRLKDVVANVKTHMTQNEVQLATVFVEHKHPHFCEGNDHDSVKKENLFTKVLKTCEKRKRARQKARTTNQRVSKTSTIKMNETS
jgi:hypothetical protein